MALVFCKCSHSNATFMVQHSTYRYFDSSQFPWPINFFFTVDCESSQSVNYSKSKIGNIGPSEFVDFR